MNEYWKRLVLVLWCAGIPPVLGQGNLSSDAFVFQPTLGFASNQYSHSQAGTMQTVQMEGAAALTLLSGMHTWETFLKAQMTFGSINKTIAADSQFLNLELGTQAHLFTIPQSSQIWFGLVSSFHTMFIETGAFGYQNLAALGPSISFRTFIGEDQSFDLSFKAAAVVNLPFGSRVFTAKGEYQSASLDRSPILASLEYMDLAMRAQGVDLQQKSFIFNLGTAF